MLTWHSVHAKALGDTQTPYLWLLFSCTNLALGTFWAHFSPRKVLLCVYELPTWNKHANLGFTVKGRAAWLNLCWEFGRLLGFMSCSFRWVGRKHYRQAMAMGAHSCPWAGDPGPTQPFGSTARPSPLALNLLMKGVNSGSPFASQEPLSRQRVGVWFQGKERRATTKCEVISSSFAWKCWGSSLQINGKGIYIREGSLPKYSSVQLTGSKHCTHLFLGGVAGSPALFGRKVWQALCDG